MGLGMRAVKTIAAGLLLCASALDTACSYGTDSSILFGGQTTPSAPAMPTTSIARSTERPARVAFISACAQAYGFGHDAAQLRSAYLSYEAKRGVIGEPLAQITRDFDEAYAAIANLESSSKSTYCSKKDGSEVRAELKRYQSGYFEDRTNSSNEGFDAAKVWTSQGDKRGGR
jgi:hypothetical protein